MTGRLAELVDERERVVAAFFAAESERIALACHAIAQALARGGTLFAYGTRAAATDAAHIAVEFMHPVVVGKRALPAVALPSDATGASTLAALARPGDVALSVAHAREDESVVAFREESLARGLVTVALVGCGDAPRADFAFVVGHDDERIVQEVQETLYHVLWELVHVFFEHPGLLVDSRSGAGEADTRAPGRLRPAYGGACITCGDVAVEARVVKVDNGNAVVEKDGVREQVAVDLVDVDVGDVVLCHAGVAIERVS